MEQQLPTNLAQYGVGVFGIGVLGFILFLVIKSFSKEMRETRDERLNNQKWFMEYVNQNNHQKDELIERHTTVLVEVKNAIQQNTETNRTLVEAVVSKK